ncbi:MAG: hypothetical protein PHW04_04815 [Candidatus Wallbacteria bacterium]|nr:hypothetical protein [Candidatus Wallbacteria bacterium]
MPHPLEKEFEYYLAHQDEFVKKYNGKFLVIKDQTILQTFDTIPEAYKFVSDKEFLGKAIIQKCSPGPDDYTMTFHSRVSFKSCQI